MSDIAAERDFSEFLDSHLQPKAPDAAAEAALARRLAQADFSGESRVRQSLRRELLAGPGAAATRLAGARRLGASVALGGLLAVGVWLVTPAGQTLAQGGIEILREWFVGDNSSLTTVEGDFQVNAGPDGRPIVSDPGEVPDILPGAEPQTPADLSGLWTAPDFHIPQPAHLPTGYVLDNASGGSGQVELLYMNHAAQSMLSILLTAVGEGRGSVQIFHTSDIPEVEVDINGHTGVWMPGAEDSMLVWEADGINFQMTSRLTLEEALAVARSFQ